MNIAIIASIIFSCPHIPCFCVHPCILHIIDMGCPSFVIVVDGLMRFRPLKRMDTSRLLDMFMHNLPSAT